jgi:hypothetical protein
MESWGHGMEELHEVIGGIPKVRGKKANEAVFMGNGGQQDISEMQTVQM